MNELFERFLGRGKKNPVEVQDPILPYPIRDHLRFSTELPKELVLSLVRNGPSEREGFENTALYLVLKASANDPELEKALLHELSDILKSDSDDTSTEHARRVRTFVESAIARIPGDWTVDARNLGRISRHGFRLTDERYRAHASILAQDPRDVFILGHATFIGLASFIRAFAKTGKRLHIVIPAFVDTDQDVVPLQTRNHTAGYVLDPDGSVRDLRADDLRGSAGKVVIDDARRTGKTEGLVRTYFEAFGVHDMSFEPMLDASLG